MASAYTVKPSSGIIPAESEKEACSAYCNLLKMEE